LVSYGDLYPWAPECTVQYVMHFVTIVSFRSEYYYCIKAIIITYITKHTSCVLPGSSTHSEHYVVAAAENQSISASVFAIFFIETLGFRALMQMLKLLKRQVQCVFVYSRLDRYFTRNIS